MHKVKLCFQQLTEIFCGLWLIDASDQVAEHWSEENVPVIGSQIGGFRLESIPPEAHLVVEVDQGNSSWGPDESTGSPDGPRSTIEAVYYAIHERFDEQEELETGPDSCMIRVTAAVETDDGLEVYIHHLLAEVEVYDLEEVEDGGPPQVRLGVIALHYLGDVGPDAE
ncbi:MAG: hypothetical protein WC400_02490 [Patescibacteria group bacterium]|jgi:hypothetical protein